MSARGGPGDDGEVPADVLARPRSVCLDLPETHEEQAWTGVRWRVRTRTFAHVLLVASGWPPAYARAVGRDGPALVLMFRSGGLEVAALRSTGRPFFAPPWRVDEVGPESTTPPTGTRSPPSSPRATASWHRERSSHASFARADQHDPVPGRPIRRCRRR